MNFKAIHKNIKNAKFGDIEIEKQRFHQHKEPISINQTQILIKFAISNKVFFGKKKDLNISLATKMRKKLDFHVYFSQKWLHIEKNKDSLKKDFDSEPVYNGKINTNFHINKIAKQDSQYICLSVFRTSKNYYSQVFLEECKYAVKGNKIPK